jgi:hypothetical protein
MSRRQTIDTLVAIWKTRPAGSGLMKTPDETAPAEALEVCVRAATRVDGALIVTDRHHQAMQALNSWGAPSRPVWQSDQGFITSRGRFVSREEGRRLQDAAGIPSKAKHGYSGDTLFSEDLY